MALFVKDPEVDKLASRLAVIRKISKTEAVRQALLHEIERENANPTLVEQGVAFCRALRARADAERARPADKAFIDSLYEND
ncbi:transcription factor [Bosea caraganae]|uniref:Transcription factor n=1 Tax=Bosea caraganae TaxID=2763117 RepID=A0A370KXZ6_9HYPH|nr:type II toxin-antitoxin system VapB family antitoxin [Bosea caraganae]RDJ19850.1 transcription factor [Bosea caraganae]RDJ25580.1 transcription factor [Bosea caraganae]